MSKSKSQKNIGLEIQSKKLAEKAKDNNYRKNEKSGERKSDPYQNFESPVDKNEPSNGDQRSSIPYGTINSGTPRCEK